MKIGVIVARYQIDVLHRGHEHVINTVTGKSDHTVILLGCRGTKNTTKNPLDFKMRRDVVYSEYGFSDVSVFPVYDNRSDEVWSANLDAFLKRMFPYDTITLYGSKDSFLPRYSGKLATETIAPLPDYDATTSREQIGESEPENDPAFRRGVIWAAYNRYPICYPTVDVAILKETTGEPKQLLLGKKHGEFDWRLIGGFADTGDASYEVAAKREALEETGLEVADVTYIGSRAVDDWRYSGVSDKVKTLLFKCKYVFGAPKGADDIEVVQWFNLAELPTNIVKEHLPLIDMLLASEGLSDVKS